MSSKFKYKIFNDFFSSDEQQSIQDYCSSAKYTFGETDTAITRPIGLVHEMSGGVIHELFRIKTGKIIPEGLKLYRMYVSCMSPGEIPYFHVDGPNCVTLVYYPQHNWKLNDGGETQIVVDENIHGIVPVSNRIVMFDGNLKYRATTFRSRHRFTVAIKYEEKTDCE